MDTNLVESAPHKSLIESTRAMTIERIAFQSGNVPLRCWWAKVGSDKVKDVCNKAGITFAHFKHVAAKRRRFSREAAAVFEKHSGLTLAELLPIKAPPPKKAKAPGAARRAKARG